MGKNERQAYLKAIRTRYRRARRKSKIAILDEFCAVCGYHRKYAIRLLNQRGKPKNSRQAGRKPTYASAEFQMALKRIWFATDQMCSKKLKAALPLWLPFYETRYQALSQDVRYGHALSCRVKLPTVKRAGNTLALNFTTDTQVSAQMRAISI